MGFGPFRVNDAEHALRRFQPRLPSPEPLFAPFRAFPSPAAVPRHRGLCPRAVSRLPRTEVRGAVPTSRPCSADESGIASRRCRRDRPVALLGFVPLQGPPRILCIPSPEGLETRPPLSFDEPDSRRAAALRRPLEESGGVLPVPRRSVRFRLRRCEPRSLRPIRFWRGSQCFWRLVETSPPWPRDCQSFGPDETGLPTLMGFVTSKTDRLACLFGAATEQIGRAHV